MEDSVSIRLKHFMDKIGVSNSEFADQCGIPRPTLSQLLSGRNKKVSDLLIGQIHRRYPSLSILWLLFGEGEMLTTECEGGAATSISDQDDLDAYIFDRTSQFRSPETTNITSADMSDEKFFKENGLTLDKNSSSDRMNTKNPEDLEKAILRCEIEKMRKNPRKVVQIMIYYDDSTFETFFPESSN